MSTLVSAPALYTIPAGVPFAKALAERLLSETDGQPQSLSAITILLPTRRACRTLREAFLDLSGGKPLLLPRMQALGDIDEEELSLNIAGQEIAQSLADLPPAIAPLRRQILLARLICESGHSFDQALQLAAALGHLMDQTYTEGLALSALVDLVPADFASHWQITLDFLKILSEHWPKILAEEGLIDAADRRNRLIHTLATHWAQTPPQGRVIAAGSTGSIPATASLLRVVAQLPQGAVVLPGLDRVLDEKSWNTLEESHPQYGLKKLLEYMGAQREDVQDWVEASTRAKARDALASELMRPASTTGQWRKLHKNQKICTLLPTALEDLSLITCAHEREEAEVIATLFRQTLQAPEQTAALITPDRNLARRVSMAALRWGIKLDDSAGQPLAHSAVGSFLHLCLKSCAQDLAPVTFLSLLKHDLCRDLDIALIDELEQNLLRGPAPPPGIEGLFARLKTLDDQNKVSDLEPLIEQIDALFTPLLQLEKTDCATLIQTHLELAEALSGPENLWAGEAGEAAASFFNQLREQAGLIPDLTLSAYQDMLTPLMQAITIRPAYGTHPRLKILGQLEARLIDADLIIMAGLNEGTWPPDPGHDPWLSRPMRADFGLPGHERSIGLSAHDFVQGFCTKKVFMTRAARTQGAPTVPARWLTRLDTVLQALGHRIEELEDPEILDWVRCMDAPDETVPIERPAPCPPLETRPRKLSVTRIEHWLKDPYGIYAQYVLGLKKLDPLEQKPDAALRGTLLHDILERFVEHYKTALPDDIQSELEKMAAEALETHHDDPAFWRFWLPRFTRLAGWLAEHETQWRGQATPLKTEAQGHFTIEPNNAEPFTLTARADRIDARKDDGTAALIDYKSGGQFSTSGLKDGVYPQLPLEALILSKGGFEGLPPMDASTLSYWILSGGNPPGKLTEIYDDLGPLIAQAEEGLTRLITLFDDPATPYYNLPNPDNAPAFNDYEHLARVREWSVVEQQSGEG